MVTKFKVSFFRKEVVVCYSFSLVCVNVCVYVCVYVCVWVWCGVGVYVPLVTSVGILKDCWCHLGSGMESREMYEGEGPQRELPSDWIIEKRGQFPSPCPESECSHGTWQNPPPCLTLGK